MKRVGLLLWATPCIVNFFSFICVIILSPVGSGERVNIAQSVVSCLVLLSHSDSETRTFNAQIFNAWFKQPTTTTTTTTTTINEMSIKISTHRTHRQITKSVMQVNPKNCCFRKNGQKIGSVGRFLPARRYASADLCDSDVSGRLSVRPSVRLSHAGIVPSRAKAGS